MTFHSVGTAVDIVKELVRAHLIKLSITGRVWEIQNDNVKTRTLQMGRSKTKPSSSSQNSDTQDTDKDIDG